MRRDESSLAASIVYNKHTDTNTRFSATRWGGVVLKSDTLSDTLGVWQ